MNEVMQMALGALQLKTEAFQAAGKGGPAGLRRAAVVVALVALISGLGLLAGGVRSAIVGFQPDAVREQFQEFFNNLEISSDIPPDSLRAIRNGVAQGVEIGLRVAELPTPLPRPLISVVNGLGSWLGQPFVFAASWLAYTLMTLVAARLLGGKASLPAMLGATALSNVPYVLNLLAFIAYCGGAVALAAWIWSSVIFVRATAVANDLPGSRAVLAWAAPAVTLFIFWSLVIAGIVVTLFIAALASAGG